MTNEHQHPTSESDPGHWPIRAVVTGSTAGAASTAPWWIKRVAALRIRQLASPPHPGEQQTRRRLRTRCSASRAAATARGRCPHDPVNGHQNTLVEANAPSHTRCNSIPIGSGQQQPPNRLAAGGHQHHDDQRADRRRSGCAPNGRDHRGDRSRRAARRQRPTIGSRSEDHGRCTRPRRLQCR